MLSAYSKSGTCCISNFKTKRVKRFRTLETDRELSKRVKVSCIISVDGIKLWLLT